MFAFAFVWPWIGLGAAGLLLILLSTNALRSDRAMTLRMAFSSSTMRQNVVAGFDSTVPAVLASNSPDCN